MSAMGGRTMPTECPHGVSFSHRSGCWKCQLDSKSGTPDVYDVSPRRFDALRRLEADWDGYGGQPPTRQALERLLRLVIVPLSDGGVQLEWNDAEIEVRPDGTVVMHAPTAEAVAQLVADGVLVERDCVLCDGHGVYASPVSTCPRCQGSGRDGSYRLVLPDGEEA